jgi:hypothetical protein
LLGKIGKQRFKIFGNPYQQDTAYQWQILSDVGDLFHFSNPLQEHFSRSDSLASYYADKYRGTFVSCFSLGGLAVLFAVLGGHFEGFPLSFKLFSSLFTGLELSMIVLIIILIQQARIQDYHRRWLDYRFLAEQLRQVAFLMPINCVPHWQLPIHEAYQDQSLAWINWLTRAVIRTDGISSSCINNDHLEQYRKYLQHIIADQAEYHRNNAERNERIFHTLHHTNLMFLILIIIACAIHLFHLIYADTPLTIAATLLPAFGATIAGILGQGEFERIAQRSKGMAVHLNKIKERLEQPMTDTHCLVDQANTDAHFLVDQANQAISIMSQELSDWRIIFRVKHLRVHV